MQNNQLSAVISILFFILILALIDVYAWKGVSSASSNFAAGTRKWLKLGYWSVGIGVYISIALVFGSIFVLRIKPEGNTSLLFAFLGILVLFTLPKLVVVVFHLVEDIFWGLSWVWSKLTPTPKENTAETIGRLRFLSQMGVILSAIPFGGILYGMTKGRSAFEVENVDIASSKIPRSFDGFKVVQISDIHLGSLSLDNELVSKGVAMINALEPDLILFTGDLVNDKAVEVEPWLDHLTGLNAKHGIYSVLGNHDYGDYTRWDSESEKAQNMRDLMAHQKKMGFHLMLDEHLPIEHGGESINLIGVQNYGGRGFAQYGDLSKALQNIPAGKFNLLMSHDPSHWDMQVRATDVDLMLAGHTHGAQMGVKIAGKRYSPASKIYKQWAGLYEQDGKQLYVNRGFGYLAFPGRVGMSPEITLLTLRSQA